MNCNVAFLSQLRRRCQPLLFAVDLQLVSQRRSIDALRIARRRLSCSTRPMTFSHAPNASAFLAQCSRLVGLRDASNVDADHTDGKTVVYGLKQTSL